MQIPLTDKTQYCLEFADFKRNIYLFRNCSLTIPFYTNTNTWNSLQYICLRFGKDVDHTVCFLQDKKRIISCWTNILCAENNVNDNFEISSIFTYTYAIGKNNCQTWHRTNIHSHLRCFRKWSCHHMGHTDTHPHLAIEKKP